MNREIDFPEAYQKAEERARWLLSLNIENESSHLSFSNQLEKLTNKIYDKEVDRIKNGDNSLFQRQDIIPDARIQDEDRIDN